MGQIKLQVITSRQACCLFKHPFINGLQERQKENILGQIQHLSHTDLSRYGCSNLSEWILCWQKKRVNCWFSPVFRYSVALNIHSSLYRPSLLILPVLDFLLNLVFSLTFSMELILPVQASFSPPKLHGFPRLSTILCPYVSQGCWYCISLSISHI